MAITREVMAETPAKIDAPAKAETAKSAAPQAK